jgi:hypothetical protein
MRPSAVVRVDEPAPGGTPDAGLRDDVLGTALSRLGDRAVGELRGVLRGTDDAAVKARVVRFLRNIDTARSRGVGWTAEGAWSGWGMSGSPESFRVCYRWGIGDFAGRWEPCFREGNKETDMTMEKTISGLGFGGRAKTMDVDFEKFMNLLAGSAVFQAKMPVGRETAPMGMTARMA